MSQLSHLIIILVLPPAKEVAGWPALLIVGEGAAGVKFTGP